MTVNRKIFATIAVFVVGLAAIFIFVTNFVVKESFDAMVGKVRGKEMDALAEGFLRSYALNGNSWEGIGEGAEPAGADWKSHPDASLLLLSSKGEKLYSAGPAVDRMVKNLGVKQALRSEGRTIAILYYYDADIANLSKLRIGVPVSVTFLLTASAIILVLVSLLVAYGIAKFITAPLRKLIPAIERLGRGELGTQAPVLSKDEYGKVALAFNAMSDRLRRTEDVRRTLVADVAHELRTPLTIVRGKLDLLQQSGAAIEPESLLPVQDELIRLSRLVDDLHLLSLAEAGTLRLEKKPTNMAELVRSVLRHVQPDAGRKQVALALEEGACEKPIPADPNRMTQVLLNLLVNAVRYTPAGGSVTAAVRERSAPAARDGEPKLTISVADTGVGIAPEQLANVFNRFYRTDEARSRDSGGMGLGLAIAREFVRAHGGTLEAESELGKGTVFVVELPM